MFLRTVLFCFILLACEARAEFYTISGTVSNAAGEPLALAQVSVLDLPHLNTETDARGHYVIRISEGTYVLVFTMQGFKPHKIPVTVRYGNVVQNCILEADETQLSSYRVSARKTDRSEEIIRKVIAGKSRFLYQEPHSVEAYIKATEVPQALKAVKDSLKLLTEGLSMAEIHMTLHRAPPDKQREIRNGVEIRGNQTGLFFLSHTDGNFNFYRNLLELPALSAAPMLSPLSNSGLLAYRYKMLKIYTENGQRYYRIKVSPGITGNALLSGELTIRDSSWTIHTLKLSIPAYHLNEYDRFEVSQEYTFTDSMHALRRMEFIYGARAGRIAKNGRTVVYYSSYRYGAQYDKKFFRTELSSTAQEAYERDSLFWLGKRTEPLSSKELAFIHRSDSLKALQSQKFWQDSADREFNRVTLKKILFTGQDFYKRSRERYWSFMPLVFVYTPVYIAGPRYRYWVNYSKTAKNKKELELSASLSFGVFNRDVKGNLGFGRLYNPFKRGYYTLSTGRDFGVINPYSSWIRGFARENFYQHQYLSGFHRIELLNGLALGTGMEYAYRQSIDGMKFDPLGDSLWGGNMRLTRFVPYSALYVSVNLYFVPFQKYIREPYQKLILGSKWPELSLRYRKGLRMLGSMVDFDYLEFVAEQEIKLGLAGVSKYRFSSGEFLNTRNLPIIDYKFQRSIGPVFFANPLYSFQGIDTSFATLRRYYEGHYFHRFNGALINKIPILKKLGISECAGAGFLLSTERRMRYLELFAGIEKSFKLMRERVRLGVFYVANFNNNYQNAPQFKFTIEVYNRIKNRWPY